MIGAIFQSFLFWPPVQTLNYGWDVASRGLSSHQVPIRDLLIDLCCFILGRGSDARQSLASLFLHQGAILGIWGDIVSIYECFHLLLRPVYYSSSVSDGHICSASQDDPLQLSLSPQSSAQSDLFPLHRIFRCLMPNCPVLVTRLISHFWPCQVLIRLLHPSPSPGFLSDFNLIPVWFPSALIPRECFPLVLEITVEP